MDPFTYQRKLHEITIAFKRCGGDRLSSVRRIESILTDLVRHEFPLHLRIRLGWTVEQTKRISLFSSGCGTLILLFYALIPGALMIMTPPVIGFLIFGLVSCLYVAEDNGTLTLATDAIHYLHKKDQSQRRKMV